MNPTLELAIDLMRRPSVTPRDAGCQSRMAERLRAIGFRTEQMPFGEVENLWARRGDAEPVVCFAGHTDVVPPGPITAWQSDPFAPEIRDGTLYGRGACDMKASLAAMVTACESFVAEHPDHAGSIALLITSDEEGPARDGTVKVVERLEARGEKIRYCIVGEPSSHATLGDTVKIGRRGSIHGKLRVIGKQGHVAYPQRARNPLHAFAPALLALVEEEWDRGNQAFPPTSFQLVDLRMGTGADNVIPGHLDAQLNLRFSTELDAETIQRRIRGILDRHGLDYQLEWRLSGNPFLTPSGALVDATRRATRDLLGIDPELSTSGGTSDGRFIAPTGAEVLELGPVSATIHQANECVRVTELDDLSRLYRRILVELLG